MKRNETTADSLREMGYEGFLSFPMVSFAGTNDKVIKADHVLDLIVQAVREGKELIFNRDDVRKEITVSEKVQSERFSLAYIRRPMTPAEALDADMRLAEQGVTVTRN